MLPKLEKMGSFQTKGSRNPKMNEKNLKKLDAQRNFEEEIIEMHCVAHFIVLMITKKLM
jgi:hypothetical protein